MLPVVENTSPLIESLPIYEYPQKGEPDQVEFDVLSSPATSTSTLSLVEDDIRNDKIRQLFLAKPNCLARVISNPSDYVGNTSGLFVSPLLTDDLNPLATPFVPKVPPPSSLPPKSRRLLRPKSVTQPRTSKWRRSFDEATRPPIEEIEIHSLIIVAAEAWEPEQLAELAQEFCWRCAEATQDDIEAILIFMLRLHWRFKHMKSKKIADEFEWHLKEFILGTFISVWDAVSFSQSCRRFHPDFFPFIAIGELFNRGFLDTRDIHNCLGVLIPNFVSVEHAEAVAALFHHTGPRYWHEHPDGRGHLQDFQYAISYIMQRLEGKMSLVNQARSDDELSTLMYSVVEQTMELDKQMVMGVRSYPPGQDEWAPERFMTL